MIAQSKVFLVLSIGMLSSMAVDAVHSFRSLLTHDAKPDRYGLTGEYAVAQAQFGGYSSPSINVVLPEAGTLRININEDTTIEWLIRNIGEKLEVNPRTRNYPPFQMRYDDDGGEKILYSWEELQKGGFRLADVSIVNGMTFEVTILTSVSALMLQSFRYTDIPFVPGREWTLGTDFRQFHDPSTGFAVLFNDEGLVDEIHAFSKYRGIIDMNSLPKTVRTLVLREFEDRQVTFDFLDFPRLQVLILAGFDAQMDFNRFPASLRVLKFEESPKIWMSPFLEFDLASILLRLPNLQELDIRTTEIKGVIDFKSRSLVQAFDVHRPISGCGYFSFFFCPGIKLQNTEDCPLGVTLLPQQLFVDC